MAISTIYGGIEFRSRLEARWAAFFRRVSWEFTYEPFDGDGYIPDFIIHGDRPLLVEVKPATTRDEYEAPIVKVIDGIIEHWHHDVLIVGVTPISSAFGNNSWGESHCAGLLGEACYAWTPGDKEPDRTEYDFAPAIWASCGNCQSHAIYHDYQSYACRPCGCYEGDHYLGEARKRQIGQAWVDACNDVKWRGRNAA